jgi:hypothetical protein
LLKKLEEKFFPKGEISQNLVVLEGIEKCDGNFFGFRGAQNRINLGPRLAS